MSGCVSWLDAWIDATERGALIGDHRSWFARSRRCLGVCDLTGVDWCCVTTSPTYDSLATGPETVEVVRRRGIINDI